MAKNSDISAPVVVAENITYEMVPVDQLKINAYQRILSIGFAKSIGNDFNLYEVGVIIVSLRDGSYNVVDGQHRVYGAKLAGIPMLMCVVNHNLSYQEEAELFAKLNKRRKGLLIFDYFNSELEAENERALEIAKTLKNYNFTLSRGTGHNQVQALNSLNSIYNRYGAKHLDDVLRLIKVTWEGENKSLGKVMLLGMAEFLDYYKPLMDERTFIRQLRKIDPEKIIREADADGSNVTKNLKVVNVLFRYYNRQLRNNALENKHFGH